MAWKLKSFAKITFNFFLLITVGFAICYVSSKWYSNRPEKHAIVFSAKPTGEVWVGAREVTSSDSDHFTKLFATTKVIVIRSWIKIRKPPIYRVISTDEEIHNIVRTSKIKYQRDSQPIHPSYQLVFVTADGDYLMNYERIPPDGSVIDVIPGTAKYDNNGIIYKFQPSNSEVHRNGDISLYVFKSDRAPEYKYIQAYPSPELQHLINKYIE